MKERTGELLREPKAIGRRLEPELKVMSHQEQITVSFVIDYTRWGSGLGYLRLF